MTASITWYGHANFQIDSPDCRILIDPFFTGNPVAPFSWDAVPAPDLVLVTHLHGDHVGDAVAVCKKTGAMLGTVVGAAEALQRQGLPGEQVLNGIGFNIGGSLTVKNTVITMTQAFHTTEAGSPTGFIIRLGNGYTIYHAGDTGIFASMAVFGDLYDIDLALLPVGGVFTMDARQGGWAAKMLKAKAALPMHWGTFPVLAQDTADFERELANIAPACAFVRALPGQALDLPSLRPR